MKAILTKTLPWTTHKPRRIKAYTHDRNSIVLSWDACTPNGENDGQAHMNAALGLCAKMNWPVVLIGGGTKEGYAFCFTDSLVGKKRA